MRLWTLHPEYLDTKGLVALWRESLLAQAVLRGNTRGYRHHPALLPFREHPDPEGAIADYLQGVHAESLRRGYRFDAARIIGSGSDTPLYAGMESVQLEWAHLLNKLKIRDVKRHDALRLVDMPRLHDSFQLRD